MAKQPFNDNVVIITGASTGIGAEMAIQLADQGAKLVLAARSVDNLEAVAAACRERGAEVAVVETDVSDKAQCATLIEKAVVAYGRIDTLVNNAGTSMWARFDELQDLGIIDRIINVNLLGSMYCSYYALPYLKKTQGRIVFINSQAGRNGVPTRTAYAASKHGLVGFADSLRIELIGTGVSVTSIYPGFVSTGIHSRIPGPDGKLLGTDHPVDYEKAMSTEKCVEITLRAMAHRKREEVMELRGKVGVFVKLIAPRLTDNVAQKAIESGR
ncbi:MAG: SDR family oxidoreductase [Anaerolineae bacterium]|nr:SDR family oxidoreductase [Anaerolineae bacterium]